MEITINNPLDMHLHLRQDNMLKKITHLSAEHFSGALIMPNTNPPITAEEQLDNYKKQINKNKGNNQFQPYVTLFFNENLDYKFLESVKDKIIAIKLYPAGITTNSSKGIEEINIEKLGHIFQAMSDLGIPLCVHGETNGFVMDREKEFISFYKQIAKNFPNLKIIMEHITTKESVDLLDKYDNLYATITLHHLFITLNDVVGGLMNPHNFCKPIAKRPEDKKALNEVALKAHPKVMFGSDSAPHPVSKKECCGCAAGVFTSPVILQTLTELFTEHSTIENLQRFVSDNAKNIYGITPIQKQVVLEQKEFEIPDKYYNIVPFRAGEKIKRSIKEIKQ